MRMSTYQYPCLRPTCGTLGRRRSCLCTGICRHLPSRPRSGYAKASASAHSRFGGASRTWQRPRQQWAQDWHGLPIGDDVLQLVACGDNICLFSIGSQHLDLMVEVLRRLVHRMVGLVLRPEKSGGLRPRGAWSPGAHPQVAVHVLGAQVQMDGRHDIHSFDSLDKRDAREPWQDWIRKETWQVRALCARWKIPTFGRGRVAV